MAQVFYSLCETILEQSCVVLRNHCNNDKRLRQLDAEQRRLTGVEPAGIENGQEIFIRGDDPDALNQLNKIELERRELKEAFEMKQS